MKSRISKIFTPTGILGAGIGALVILIGIVTIYKINSQKTEFKTVYNPEKAKEVGLSLKETVSKIYAVPDENPTVATVTDTKVLPSDAFYQKARAGDKILIFPMAKKAIMYRPTENRIIDVAEVAQPTPQTPPPLEEVAGASSSESASLSKSNPKVLKSESVSPTKTIRVNFKPVTPTLSSQ